jgi:hypothetical protein
MIDITKVIKVTVYDYTEYKSETSRNGGDYGYTETYTRVSGDAFEVSYGTTAEFDYCPRCGSFYQGECSCVYPNEGDYDRISQAQLREMLEKIDEEENDDIYYRIEKGDKR